MDPIPEAEELRTQLQLRHIEHVNVEISLSRTLFGTARGECGMGFLSAGAASLAHAREAIAGARAGRGRIDSETQRSAFEQTIVEIETAIQTFKVQA